MENLSDAIWDQLEYRLYRKTAVTACSLTNVVEAAVEQQI